MKKVNLFLFIGALAAIGGICSNGSTISTYADDSSFKIEYEEDSDSEFNRSIRTVINYCPFYITETLKAPNGSILYFSAEKDELAPFVDEVFSLPELTGLTTIPAINVVVNRNFGGASFYSDSTIDWDINKDSFEDKIISMCKEVKLFEVQEKNSEFELGGTLEIDIMVDKNDFQFDYIYVFNPPVYQVKPYGPGDFIALRSSTYYALGDKRFTVLADINPDLFNPDYGFASDGRIVLDQAEGTYLENYKITYYAKDSNTVIAVDNGNLEMSPAPSTPMTIYAKLTFEQDEEEYSFYSNDIVAEEKIPKPSLDGFSNRDSYTVGEKNHKLQLNCCFPLDIIERFLATLSYEKNGAKITLKEINYCKYPYIEETGEFDYANPYPDMDESYLICDLPFEETGEYEIFGDFSIETKNEKTFGSDSYYNNSCWSTTIKVIEGETPYTKDINKAFTIETQINNEVLLNDNNETLTSINCVVGGNPIEILLNVPDDLLEYGPTFTTNIDMLSGSFDIKMEKDRIVVIPKKEGSDILKIDANVMSFGTISKEVKFNVINVATLNCDISVPDEFHYSNEDLKVTLLTENNLRPKNFNYEWQVKDSRGNNAEFVINEDGNITIINPIEEDYTVTLYFNGFEQARIKVQVRNIDFDRFLEENLWWMFIAAFGLLALAICTKVLLTKNVTIVNKVGAICEIVNKIDITSKESFADLGKARFMLEKEISYTRDLNIDGMNQYEKSIRYLNKSLTDIKYLEKMGSGDSESHLEAYERLKKDLNKAHIVITDIQNARLIAEKNSAAANKNNFAKIEKEKKSKK